jgi:hypothetical protein
VSRADALIGAKGRASTGDLDETMSRGADVRLGVGSWKFEPRGRITIQALEPLDLHERLGPTPDVDAVHASITGLMQRTLDELALQRRWPVVG